MQLAAGNSFLAAPARTALYSQNFPQSQYSLFWERGRNRLERILPPDLRARINDFTLKQLIALGFASDAELPDLARKVLNENLTDGTAVKKIIRNWQPDSLRVCLRRFPGKPKN